MYTAVNEVESEIGTPTEYIYMCTWKFSQRRKFSLISSPALIGENFITLTFCPANDYTADMVTFTALAEIYSTKMFLQYMYKGSWAL
jgi:hypothetical protein